MDQKEDTGRQGRRNYPKSFEPGFVADGRRLHVAAVLAAGLEECVGDLAQGTILDRLHQYGEHVFTAGGGFLEAFQHRRGGLLVTPLKVA